MPVCGAAGKVYGVRDDLLGRMTDYLDAARGAGLLRALFCKRSPLHDGAVILSGGRLSAAGCQLPLGQPPEGLSGHMGMRHRSALCMSDETDAVLLVVGATRATSGARSREPSACASRMVSVDAEPNPPRTPPALVTHHYEQG